MKRHTASRHLRVLVLGALVGVLAAVVALTAPATAMASPCGDKVLADWFDNGRIDRLYAAHCYEDAIDAIPRDLRDYANAEEVILRALQSSLRGELDPGGPDPSPDGSGGSGSGGSGGTPPTDPGDGGTGGSSEAAPDVDTTGISTVPIPLIVLAGMSVALLTAGGLGYLRRRNAVDGPPGPDDLLE